VVGNEDKLKCYLAGAAIYSRLTRAAENIEALQDRAIKAAGEEFTTPGGVTVKAQMDQITAIRRDAIEDNLAAAQKALQDALPCGISPEASIRLSEVAQKTLDRVNKGYYDVALIDLIQMTAQLRFADRYFPAH
jgi:hypothetical protein